ncbi:MAG: hypothetical protein JWM42_714 [Burkholderia sp.]|nr:hypothetical protein [Burkholderia sp.]
MALFRFLILLLAFMQPAPAANNDEAFWSALKSGKAPRRNKLGNLAAVAGCGARREEES